MIFENLRVGRIVVHEVLQRSDDRAAKPPVLSQELENLDAEAIGAFQLRMTDALSGRTQSLQMRIANHGTDSYIALAEGLIRTSDKDFLAGSQAIATKLAGAQIARQIPGGMLIVFDGTVGAPAVPFLGVIKAETQAGFRRSRSGERTIVEFLKNIFLTPATRLYKIGLVLFDDISKSKPDGRRAFVFDSNISASKREAAAAYFYDAFLGCALPSDGPYETARFFDLTKDFIRRSDLPPENKRDLIDSVYVFVRDEKDPTFTADQFADRFLPLEMRDDYSDFMRGKKFTPNAVVRDISRMGNRLRRRRLKFGADIELSASPEALASKVQITAIKGETAGAESSNWTQIVIREALTGEQ